MVDFPWAINQLLSAGGDISEDGSRFGSNYNNSPKCPYKRISKGSRGGVSVAPYQVNRPRLDDKGHLLIAASQEDIVVLASSFGSANK